MNDVLVAYAKALADSILSLSLGLDVEAKKEEAEKLAQDLLDAYASAGFPYGEDRVGLFKFLAEHIEIKIE